MLYLLKTSNFRLAPPCSSLFILHVGCLWIFLNEKLRSEKREKIFFCKLNIKDGNVAYTDIYTITTIKLFTCSYIKKSLRKCLRRFNKTFSNYQATIRRNYLLFEKLGNFFSQSEHRDRLNPSPPLFVFIHSLRTSFSPSTTKPLLKRVRWKRWKELMIMLVHSCI